MKNLFLISFCLLLVGINTSCTKTENGIITQLPSINSDNNKVVGASAKDLLVATIYTSVKVEIQYMPGYAPDPVAISNLTSFFYDLINKPNGITVVQTPISASGKSTLSLNDIATIEKNNRTVFSSGSQLGVYFLYSDGAYSEGNVLGLAYRNTSICIIGKTISDNSGAVGQVSRTKLETTVLKHEIGHILGLVDLGSTMQTNHKDAAHGNHCSNTNCLMYYASETTDALGFLLTGAIPGLDFNCSADLRANGGK